jgi:uncharacterized membrane protein
MGFWSLLRSAALARKGLLRFFLFVSVIGILLVLSRQFMSIDRAFLFLFWNFFLAGLPLIISSLMREMASRGAKNSSLLAVGIVWLLFLPNAPYMLTDYVHLMYSSRFYFLLDFFTLSWFAVSAFIAGIVSLNDISTLLLARYRRYQVSLMVLVICLMCSFGIYLGRDLRFNSWDVITKPQVLFAETVERLSNPYADYYTWVSALTIGLLLFVVYQGIRLLKRFV